MTPGTILHFHRNLSAPTHERWLERAGKPTLDRIGVPDEARFAPLEPPRSVLFADVLPMTLTGKTRRYRPKSARGGT